MNQSLTVKILVLPLMFLVGLLLLGLLNIVLGGRILDRVIYPRFESQLLGSHKDSLKALVDAEATALASKLKGVSNRDEQIKVVTDETDPIRFFNDNSGYYFTYDMSGVRVNVPINKSQNGQNLIGLQDKKGIRFVEQFISAARAGGGFVEYFFEKEGKGVQPKLSYVRLIPGTDIFIGTGVYVDDVETERAVLQGAVKSDVRSYALIALVVFVVFIALVVFVSVFIARSLTKQIKGIALGLSSGAGQVAGASAHVSASSQQLAEGASQQAASIEETSSALEELSSMTRRNADNAAEANRLMSEAHSVVGQANQSMHRLTESMQEISRASEDTQKIIKTIDEIAFQTNLLALNAAVEAARAGEAGAGFAVVADEVRNLALRAADAARNTAALIEGTVKRVKEGTLVVTQTDHEFGEVSTSVSRSKELAGEIASASSEQAQGIEQVSRAVSEMDQVTQRNAASAEESASASEEMSAQAAQMKGYVTELVALVGGRALAEKEGMTGSGRERGTVRTVSVTNARKALPKSAAAPPRKPRGVQPARRGIPSQTRSPEEVIPFDDEEFKDF